MISAPAMQVLACMIPLVLGLATLTGAEDDEGKLLYRIHCQACHGESGKGDGPMKDQLDMTIPDLTMIATRNDGEFPTEKIHQTIDGRQESPAHGSRAMPVWGFTFQATGRDTDQEEEVRGMIVALTRYLETLQVGAKSQPGLDESDH